ncbi:hypothetical protein J5N97_029494 [Dioscorea zingiberensis]|uniref:Uncharacterized protein n=1 Tax=Dioscorea zingiberensis TaxID=325984 RepID=A0A9D5C0I0_9LILI|nr:hypothetical protein J5N97_029494 [Dioscorea zingiberensis]
MSGVCLEVEFSFRSESGLSQGTKDSMPALLCISTVLIIFSGLCFVLQPFFHDSKNSGNKEDSYGACYQDRNHRHNFQREIIRKECNEKLRIRTYMIYLHNS